MNGSGRPGPGRREAAASGGDAGAPGDAPEPDPSETAAVVVHYGGWEPTRRCVASLRSTAPEASILVVDNDEEGRAPSDLGAPVVQSPGNVGYGAGCNLGASRSTGDLLLFLNNDVEVLPGAVARLRDAVLADPRCAAAGPLFLDGAGRNRRSIRLAPTPWRVLCENLMLPRLFPFLPFFRGHHTAFVAAGNRRRRAATLLGALFLIRRTAFEEAGGFDESYFFYAEESDLFARLGQKGWRLAYEPAARAVHHEGLASRSVPQSTLDRWLHEGLLRYARRFHGASGERRTLAALRAGARLRWALSFVPGPRGRLERRNRYAEILRFHREDRSAGASERHRS
ncbi:MAG: glycosyltransferase family 2 protein [Acidobacteriota bacterium]